MEPQHLFAPLIPHPANIIDEKVLEYILNGDIKQLIKY